MSEQIGVAPTGQALTAAPRPLRVVVAEGDGRTVVERLRELGRRLGVRAAGWTLLLAVVLAWVVGMALGWQELRLFALAGTVVALCSAAFMIGRPHFDVHIEVPTKRVTVGDAAAVTLWVRNPSEKRSRGARIELPIAAQRPALQVGGLAAGGVHRADFTVPTQRRSVVPVGPARSVLGDPFGLTARESDWTGVVEVFVHPRTISLPGRQAGFVHDLEGHATEHLSPSDMSFHALREYVPGDDRRHVHWRSTARTGKLMVRQFEETRQSRMAIGIDLATDSYADADEFELAVQVAASIALNAVREGNPLGVLAGPKALPAAGGAGLLDELCRIELSPRTTLDETVTAITGQEANASIIALVTGSAHDQVDVRRACAQFGLDARVLGVRVARGAEASARATANVAILQVGELADLPRTLRQVS